MAFLQRLGETTFDTKFDLTADVERFLVQSLSLWNQDSNFGELQNQAYGYLFPQGAFFLLGDGLGDPGLGRAARLDGAAAGGRLRGHAAAVAGAAARGLARGRRGSAGVAFATAPRLLGLVGVLSAEVLPTAVLPWVVLPLVLAQQGRIGVRAGALWSGVALLFIGGVNAVENLAALPLPLFVVLSTGRPPGWVAAGALVAGRRGLASAWWMLPAAGAGAVQPAVPGLHRDLRGRGAPAGLDQRRPRRRPLGLLRVRRAASRGGPAPTTCPPTPLLIARDRAGRRGRAVGADPCCRCRCAGRCC